MKWCVLHVWIKNIENPNKGVTVFYKKAPFCVEMKINKKES